MPTPDPEAPGKGRSRWVLVAKVCVSIALLAVLLRRVDVAATGRALAAADRGLVACAVLLYLAGQTLSAVKWRMLARAVGFSAGVARFVAYYYIGMFFNAFGFGTVGGDVLRALYLAGDEGRRAVALNTVVADRVSGLLVLLAIALVSLLAFHQYDLPTVLYWTPLCLSAALLGGWRLAPTLLPLVFAPENRLRRLVEQDLAPYWNDFGLLARVSLLSLLFHLSQILVLYVLTRALGLDVPVSYFFIFGPLVNILAAIPVSVNGLGVRESGYVFFLSHIGMNREPATAFAFSWFAVVMLSGLVGGAVYLAHRRR